jgi:hypothetical protein
MNKLAVRTNSSNASSAWSLSNETSFLRKAPRRPTSDDDFETAMAELNALRIEVAVAEHEAQTASIDSRSAAVVASSSYGQNVRVLYPRSARAK